MNPRITMNARQVHSLMQLVGLPSAYEDGDDATQVTIVESGEGIDGPGLYAWLTEYPEEGAVFLGTADDV